MSFLRNTTKRGGSNKRGMSGAAEAAARFGQQPPRFLTAHRCWKCDDGRKPCAEGRPSACGYPRALND